MGKTVVLGSHTSSNRDSWWYLEREEDGSLYVRYENDDDHSEDWRKPMHEVLAGSGSAKNRVQEWIGSMMDKSDA